MSMCHPSQSGCRRYLYHQGNVQTTGGALRAAARPWLIWSAQICIFGCIFGRIIGRSRIGQVGCPWKDLAKCSSDALFLGQWDPPFKSYDQIHFFIIIISMIRATWSSGTFCEGMSAAREACRIVNIEANGLGSGQNNHNNCIIMAMIWLSW